MKTRNIPQILSSIREIAGLGLPQELMWVWMALDTNSLLAEIWEQSLQNNDINCFELNKNVHI